MAEEPVSQIRCPQGISGDLNEAANQLIIGQQTLMERLLIALLSNGHLLVEGAPGLAKTTAIKVIADRIEGDFHRIQFTPDLLPADLTGTEIYRPQEGTFEFQQGPIFHNLISCRRGEPGPGQGTVGPAGGHG